MHPKHIGIVACSVEGAALCYKTIGIEAEVRLGEWNHPRITMDSIPMAAYMPAFFEKRYDEIANLMGRSISAVAAAGANFAICPDNSCHVALPYLKATPIPLISIVDVVAKAALDSGLRKVAILGTKFTMESAMYPDAFAKHGIASIVPSKADQDVIDRLIFAELVKGIFTSRARQFFDSVIDRMAEQGCDGAALVCTEIPLVVQESRKLALLDSTRLLAAAALAYSLTSDDHA